MPTSRDFPVGAKVTASLGGVGYPAIVIETPAGHPSGEGMVSVEFTPPVADMWNLDRLGHFVVLTAFVGNNTVTAGWPGELDG